MVAVQNPTLGPSKDLLTRTFFVGRLFSTQLSCFNPLSHRMRARQPTWHWSITQLGFKRYTSYFFVNLGLTKLRAALSQLKMICFIVWFPLQSLGIEGPVLCPHHTSHRNVHDWSGETDIDSNVSQNALILFIDQILLPDPGELVSLCRHHTARLFLGRFQTPRARRLRSVSTHYVITLNYVDWSKCRCMNLWRRLLHRFRQKSQKKSSRPLVPPISGFSWIIAHPGLLFGWFCHIAGGPYTSQCSKTKQRLDEETNQFLISLWS